jgi:hypothetical protein
MDVKEMIFEAAVFDVVIDKACLDSILCGLVLGMGGLNAPTNSK